MNSSPPKTILPLDDFGRTEVERIKYPDNLFYAWAEKDNMAFYL